jgi:hypothetical protein
MILEGKVHRVPDLELDLAFQVPFPRGFSGFVNEVFRNIDARDMTAEFFRAELDAARRPLIQFASLRAY